MACTFKEKVKDYLEEKLSPNEMEIIEKHLDNCQECQKELDRYLDNKLILETEELEMEDEVLVSKIKARIKGKRRIILYGLLGFFLGLFSRFYTLDDFLLTKAIMALPYKLAEFALGLFFSDNVLPLGEEIFYHYQGSLNFFPYHPVLDFLATSFTPAIIASFIAITVGYLLSDKRVFRRKNIIKFLAIWLIIFLVWIGALHGTYSFAVSKIEKLEGIKDLIVYAVEKNSSSWLIRIDKNALQNEKYARLANIITQAEKVDKKFYPQEKEGYEFIAKFSGGGTIPIYLDKNTGEMIMQNGNTYQISSENLEFIKEVLGGEENE
ncbi:MAG: zf-HC2 domain-containing protein [Clostridia bacterium]|nr:zf-HC2 domain-containing protein [Clostridia bacterium]